jgi:hypothetical protein
VEVPAEVEQVVGVLVDDGVNERERIFPGHVPTRLVHPQGLPRIDRRSGAVVRREDPVGRLDGRQLAAQHLVADLLAYGAHRRRAP